MTAVRRYEAGMYDSSRWDGFELRPGDIISSTAPKCGTTWTRMICALLMLQEPGLPVPLDTLSPWTGMVTRARTGVFADLEARTHRRFIKTRTPLDQIPADPAVPAMLRIRRGRRGRWGHCRSPGWRPSPAARARTIAWARSATCSLVKMLDTWLRMVFGLRNSRLAMSVLATPAAMRSSTSRSRALSWGNSCLS